jgi:hypothetical protein
MPVPTSNDTVYGGRAKCKAIVDGKDKECISRLEDPEAGG